MSWFTTEDERSSWPSMYSQRAKPRPVGPVDLMCDILRESPRLTGAACASHPRLFDADADEDQLIEAIAICAVCPVRQQCFDYAGTLDSADGVYGGKLWLGGWPMDLEEWLVG